MSSWSNCGFLISIPNLILRWYVNKYYWDMKDFYKFFFQIWEEWLTVFNKCMSCMLSCFSSVQFIAQSCLTLCDSMNCSTPGLLVHHQFLESTQTHVIESVMPSSHLILCRPLLLLPPILPSIKVFSSESTLHEVAKVLEFQLQHQSFQWTPRTGLL